MTDRRRTSVFDNEPTYRVIRPKLTMHRPWKTERFDAQIVPNDMHWAAEKGNINLLADLLMQNHDVNATDAFGRTPLHEAAENNQLQAADWLMFDGADSHAKDYEDCSPMSLSQSEEMARILSQTSSGRKPEILILLEDTTYHVDNLDIRVITGSIFGPIPSYMICRRVSPSKSSLRYRLMKGERFWRDVIEYKVSLVTGWTSATVDILVVDMPPSSSELVVKTEDGDGRIKDIKPKLNQFQVNDTQCWMCTVTIQLDNFGCFALCCRPRSEVMQIPRTGGQIVSKNNKSVRLNVPPQAFKKPGNVLFTIEEVPELENEESIISMSHFYNMEHSSCSDAKEDIEVTLPIPDGYTGEGEVVVLSRPGSSSTTEGGETEEEDVWEVKEATVEPDECSVSFRTNKMGINAPVEVEKGTNREELRAQTARIFSKRKECHVKFLVVGKVLGFNQFDIVVECVKSDQIYLRIQDWKTESYSKLRLSGDFLSVQNQKYRLELQGNLKCLYGLNDLYLEFLAGQTSHQSLLVTVQNVHDAPNGNIAVHEVRNGGVRLVTQLPILLQEQLDLSVQMKKDDSSNCSEVPANRGNKSMIPRRVHSFPGEMQTSDMNTSKENERSNDHYDNADKQVQQPSFVPDTDEVDAVLDDSKPEDWDISQLSVKRDKIPRTPIARRDMNRQRSYPGLASEGQSAESSENVVQSSSGRTTKHTRRPSDPNRDCLPAGVGESVTLGGAAGGDSGWNNRVYPKHGAAVSIPTAPSKRNVSSLSQHLMNTGPASEGPEESSVGQGLSAPISDNFFVQLVREMHPDFLLFIQLGLTNTEVKKIQRNTANMDIEYTMFEMLVQCRQKRGDNAAFLHTLLLTLEEFQHSDTKQWVVNWIKQWLQTVSSEDGSFANKIRWTVKRFEDG